MKVKIQCGCETRFEFEIEPVNERMPVPVSCPGCGADATGLANEVIRRQLAPQSAVVVTVAPVQPALAPVAKAVPTAAAPAPVPVVAAPHPPVHARARIVVPTGATPPPPPGPPPPAPAPPAAGLRIARSGPAPAPAAEPQTTPAQMGVAAGVAEGLPQSPFCSKHVTEQPVDKCRVCGKPICPMCMEQFGYVCSGFCKNQAVVKRIFVPVFEGQKATVQKNTDAKAKRITLAVVAGVALVAGLFAWYTFWARDPKLVYSQKFAEKVAIRSADLGFEAAGYIQLVEPDRLLTIKDNKLAMLDITEQKELWTAPFLSDEEQAAVKAERARLKDEMAKARKAARQRIIEASVNDGDFDEAAFLRGEQEETDDYTANSDNEALTRADVKVTGTDIWVVSEERIKRFDRQTGSKKDVALPENIIDVTAGPDSILVVGVNKSGQQSLTRISLTDGTVQAEEFGAPTTALATTTAALTTNRSSGRPNGERATSPVALARGAVSRGQTTQQATMDDLLDDPELNSGMSSAMSVASQSAGRTKPIFIDPSNATYVPAGPNVVQFSTKLLEHKTVTRQAIRSTRSGNSVLDGKNVNASQALDLADEMFGEAQRNRTGGYEIEDVSRYEVTLRRHFAKDVPDWTGEVTSRPEFVALKTVDILTAGTNLYVFDKQNKKLWEAKLAHPAATRSWFSDEAVPCLETKDALYFADKGTLTRYDLQTGNVRWRLPSVGITRIQEDAKGNIYLDTTADTPDNIQFSQQVSLRQRKEKNKVIMKVDAAKGKKIWAQDTPAYQFGCLLGGKFVYSMRLWEEQDMLKFEDGPDSRIVLKLLSPGSGNAVWSYPLVNKTLLRVDVQKNWIMMHFEQEVRVLKFFSL